MSNLKDSFGRPVGRLRLSITDRCNLRCRYCMPDEVRHLPHDQLLSYEESARLARISAELGIDKVRITGGEPLVRHGVPELIRRLRAIGSLKSVALTTNGILLSAQARALREAGLTSINVSLDTLRRDRFEELCRRDLLTCVLEGLDAARAAGFERIKVNCVVMRGVNDDEIGAFVRMGRGNGYQVRFIEFMPFEAEGLWSLDKVVSQDEILDRVDSVSSLDRTPSGDSRDPARLFRFSDGHGEVGVIASVSHPFCSSCDRLRITADGKLRACLFVDSEVDLRAAMRSGSTDEALARFIVDGVAAKDRGRSAGTDPLERPCRSMHAIGG